MKKLSLLMCFLVLGVCSVVAQTFAGPLTVTNGTIRTGTNHLLLYPASGKYVEARSQSSSWGLVVRGYNSSNYGNIKVSSAGFGLGYNTSGHDLLISTDRKIGIGGITPTEKLTVNGNILLKGDDGFNASGESANVYLGDQNHFIKSTNSQGVTIGTYGAPSAINILQGGKVGIGTTTPFRNIAPHLNGNGLAISGGALLLGSGTSFGGILQGSYGSTYIPELGGNAMTLQKGLLIGANLYINTEGNYSTMSGGMFSGIDLDGEHGQVLFYAGNPGDENSVDKTKMKINYAGVQMPYLDLYSSGAHHTGTPTLLVRDHDNRGTLVLESKKDKPNDLVFKNNGRKNAWISTRSSADDYRFHIYTNKDGNANLAMSINEDGNVGIGTTDTKGSKLGVNGTIAAKEVVVAMYDNWPDYVFSNEYNLPKLSEVEEFVNENSHLPNVPSAATVAEDGVSLGEMNKILLQKVEELTLYIIEQEKRISDLECKVK